MSTEKTQSAIAEVRDQLSLDYADGKHLNGVTANVGLNRPRTRISDDRWRAIAKSIGLHYKQIKTKFEEILAIRFGPRVSANTSLAQDAIAGATTIVVTDSDEFPQVGDTITAAVAGAPGGPAPAVPFALNLGTFVAEDTFPDAITGFAFGAHGTKGLLVGGGTWAHSPSAGTWTSGLTTDLFSPDDNENMYRVAFGTGNNCAMIGARATASPQKAVALYSTDAGLTWYETPSNISSIDADNSVTDHYIASSSNEMLAFFTEISGLTRITTYSSDGGINWTVGATFTVGVYAPLGPATKVGTRWLVGVTGPGGTFISRSDDNGTTWTNSAALSGTGLIAAANIVAANDGDILAFGWTDHFGTFVPAIWRSSDIGLTWSLESTPTGLGLTTNRVPFNAVLVDGVLVCTYLFLVPGDAVAWSGDNGLTWTEVNTGLGTGANIMYIAEANGRFAFGHNLDTFASGSYIITGGGGTSVDLGSFVVEETMSAAAGTLGTLAFSSDGSTGLVPNPGNDLLYRSTSQGTWTNVSTLSLFDPDDGEKLYDVAFGSGNNCVTIGGRVGTSEQFPVVLHSNNGGATWTETLSDLSAIITGDGPPAYVAYGNGVFVANWYDSGLTELKVAFSTDQGVTWTVGASAFTPGAAFVTYAGAGHFILTIVGASAYYWTDDNGATLNLVALPGTASVVTTGSALLANGEVLIAGAVDAPATYTPALFRSLDNGETFSVEVAPTGLGNPGIVPAIRLPYFIVDFGTFLATRLFSPVGIVDTIATSIDNGITWVDHPDGIGLPAFTAFVGKIVIGNGRITGIADTIIYSSEIPVLTAAAGGGSGGGGSTLGSITIDEGTAVGEVVTYSYIDRYTNTVYLDAPLEFSHTANVRDTEQSLVTVDTLTDDRIVVPNPFLYPDPALVGEYPITIGAGTPAEELSVVTAIDTTNKVITLSYALANTHAGVVPSSVKSSLSQAYNPVHPTSGAPQVQGSTVLSVASAHQFPSRGNLLLGRGGPGETASVVDPYTAAAGGTTSSIILATDTLAVGKHSGARVVFNDTTTTAALRNVEAVVVTNTATTLVLDRLLSTPPVSGDTFFIRPLVDYTSIDFTTGVINLREYIADVHLPAGTLVEVMEAVNKSVGFQESVDTAQFLFRGAGWEVIQSTPRLVEVLIPDALVAPGTLRGNSYLHTTHISPTPQTEVDVIATAGDASITVAGVTGFPYVGVITLNPGGTPTEEITYVNPRSQLYDYTAVGAGTLVLFNTSQLPSTGSVVADPAGVAEVLDYSANDTATNTLTLIGVTTVAHAAGTQVFSTTLVFPNAVLANGYAVSDPVALYQPEHGASGVLDGNLWLQEDVFPGPYVYKPDEVIYSGYNNVVNKPAIAFSTASTTLVGKHSGPTKLAISQLAPATALEVVDASNFSFTGLPYTVSVGVSTGNEESVSVSAIALKSRTHTTVNTTAGSIGDMSLRVTTLLNTMSGEADSFPNARGYRVLLDKGTAQEEVVYVRGTETVGGPIYSLLLTQALTKTHAVSTTVELMADVLTVLPLLDDHTGIAPYSSQSTSISGGTVAANPTISKETVDPAELVCPRLAGLTVANTAGYPAAGTLLINYGNTTKGAAVRMTAATLVTGTQIPIPDSSVVPSSYPFSVTVGLGKTAEVVTVTGKAGNNLTLSGGTFLRYAHPYKTYVEFTVPPINQHETLEQSSVNSYKHMSEELVEYSSVAGNTFSFSSPTVLQFTHNPGDTVSLSLQDSLPSTDGYDFPFYLPSDLEAQLSELLDLVRAGGVQVVFISKR